MALKNRRSIFFPVYRIKCEIVPCCVAIQKSPLSQLPRIGLESRQYSYSRPHSISSSSRCIIAGESPKSSLILATPVLKSFWPVFKLFDQKPPRRCIREFDWGCIRELPVHDADNLQSIVQKSFDRSEIITPQSEWTVFKT